MYTSDSRISLVFIGFDYSLLYNKDLALCRVLIWCFTLKMFSTWENGIFTYCSCQRYVATLMTSTHVLHIFATALWNKLPIKYLLYKDSDQIRSVAQSCPTLCDPMNRSRPGLPVHHQLPEFTQTHVHRVSDAIQPSHPLSSPSPPALNPSQHQSLFQWVNSLHEVAKVLEFQL